MNKTTAKCIWVLGDGKPCAAKAETRLCPEHQAQADEQDRLDAEEIAWRTPRQSPPPGY
jgi:hypothetical protein